MLRKEQEELNNWTRLVTQIYFAWYAFFLTLSGAALTWAFKPEAGADPRSIEYGKIMFATWSLLGAIYSGHSCDGCNVPHDSCANYSNRSLDLIKHSELSPSCRCSSSVITFRIAWVSVSGRIQFSRASIFNR